MHFLRAWLKKCDFKDGNHHNRTIKYFKLQHYIPLLLFMIYDHNVLKYVHASFAFIKIEKYISWSNYTKLDQRYKSLLQS